MRIRDYILLAMVLIWLIVTLAVMAKRKKQGMCIGCSGGACASCPKQKAADSLRSAQDSE